jgi:hypothetical protein
MPQGKFTGSDFAGAVPAQTPERPTTSQAVDPGFLAKSISTYLRGQGQVVPADEIESYLRRVPDVAIGVAKQLGRTVVGFGQLVTSIPGVASVIDAGNRRVDPRLPPVKSSLDAALLQPELTPSNTDQQAGGTLAQLAEFVALPTGKTNVVGRGVVATAKRLIPQMATQASAAALLTGANTGSADDAKMAGIIGAIVPPVTASMSAFGRFLKERARIGVNRFLDPTTLQNKTTAWRIEDGVLNRNIVGSQAPVGYEQAPSTAHRSLLDGRS